MAADIGFIAAVIGTATATAEDGTVRVLQAGDRIYADEVISTGTDGGVEIEFTDSSVMALGRDSQTVLDGNAYSAEGVAAVDSDVEALQQALLDGVDPTQEGEATAAGAGAESGNEGSSSVTVEYLAPEAVVTNGFDTTGIDLAFPEILDEIQDETIPDGRPSITIRPDSDVAYEFTVTNYDSLSGAWHHSSYGYYIKDADGNPTSGAIIWDDVHDTDAITETITGYTPDQIGFFIIPNGEGENFSTTNNIDHSTNHPNAPASHDGENDVIYDGMELSFKFVNSAGVEVPLGTAGAAWQAFTDGGVGLRGDHTNVIFDVAPLNEDGEAHVKNTSTTGSQNWEDVLFDPARDPNSQPYDYGDIHVDVVWTKVTATGDDFDVSFGVDGPAAVNSIDFTIEGVSTSTALTSNSNAIVFNFRDTNGDGSDDQLYGQANGQDVLTIDGILDSDDYDIQLFGPIDAINNTTGIEAASIQATVKVTDSDGDTALVSLNFNLNIVDLPVPDVI